MGILYINHSQKHECRNRERGHAVSFLGIFVSNFQYSVIAVHREIMDEGWGVVGGGGADSLDVNV